MPSLNTIIALSMLGLDMTQALKLNYGGYQPLSCTGTPQQTYQITAPAPQQDCTSAPTQMYQLAAPQQTCTTARVYAQPTVGQPIY